MKKEIDLQARPICGVQNEVRDKKDFGPFEFLQVGGWLILARKNKCIRLADQVTGEMTSWIEIGGLRLRMNKSGELKISPGAWQVNLDAVRPHEVTTDPLMHNWMLAGAKIGESFCSYDKQPKMRGPKNRPIYLARIKRRADFDKAVELWHSWLKWRLSGSQESFQVFHLGALEKYTAGKKMADADAAARLYEARCRAIVQRLQGDYGLTLDREFVSAITKACKVTGLAVPAFKKNKTTKK